MGSGFQLSLGFTMRISCADYLIVRDVIDVMVNTASPNPLPNRNFFGKRGAHPLGCLPQNGCWKSARSSSAPRRNSCSRAAVSYPVVRLKRASNFNSRTGLPLHRSGCSLALEERLQVELSVTLSNRAISPYVAITPEDSGMRPCGQCRQASLYRVKSCVSETKFCSCRESEQDAGTDVKRKALRAGRRAEC